jgi:hypothetical protein
LSPEGLVCHPALSSWDSKKSSLSNVLREVSKSFEQFFPIVASAPVRNTGPYPDLNTTQPSHHFVVTRQNPCHAVYFEMEERIKYLEEDIHQNCLYLEVSPDDPSKVIIELKKKYHDLFILNRKKEKLVILLSKLG